MTLFRGRKALMYRIWERHWLKSCVTADGLQRWHHGRISPPRHNGKRKRTGNLNGGKNWSKFCASLVDWYGRCMLKYLKKSGIPWEFPRHQVLQVASHYLPEERRSSTADSAQAKNSQTLGAPSKTQNLQIELLNCYHNLAFLKKVACSAMWNRKSFVT